MEPIAGPRKKTGNVTMVGCNREENKVPLKPVKEVIERTNKRSIKAPLKPKKKNLIQRSGSPIKEVIKQPRRITPNNMREENKERAKQRLKLKTRSLFMEVRLIIKSERKVRKKKIPPKPRPRAKFS